MSSLHRQAMQHVFHQLQQRMRAGMSVVERTALQLLIQRLAVMAGGPASLGRYRLLLVHGSSPRSLITLSMLRAAQLTIARRQPETFQLVLVHAPELIFGNAGDDDLRRACEALFLYDDPRVELTGTGPQGAQAGGPDYPPLVACSPSRATDWLLCGHLGGRPAPPWAQLANVRLAEVYQRALAGPERIDAVIIGDLPIAQRRYLGWARRECLRAGLAPGPFDAGGNAPHLHAYELLRQAWHRQTLSETAEQMPPLQQVGFLSISDVVGDDPFQRTALLDDLLGYRYGELALGGISHRGSGALLEGHLLGLRAEHLEQRTYAQGLDEYLRRVKASAGWWRLPAALRERAVSDLGAVERARVRRQQASSLLQDTAGITDTQVLCLLCTPFVDAALGLQGFLRRCHPGMLVSLPYLVKALRGEPAPAPLTAWLSEVSGLPLPALQALYRLRRSELRGRSRLVARQTA